MENKNWRGDIKMKCTSCDHENTEEAKFCSECGASLEVNQSQIITPPPSNEKDKPQISKKGGCLGCLGLIVVLIIIAAIIGSNSPDEASTDTSKTSNTATTTETSEKPKPAPKPKLELLESSSTSDGFASYIVGKIRNNTNKKYSYVQVEISLYDSAGNQAGSTLANINNLEPGAIWSFKAVALADNVAKYKIADITGF